MMLCFKLVNRSIDCLDHVALNSACINIRLERKLVILHILIKISKCYAIFAILKLFGIELCFPQVLQELN